MKNTKTIIVSEETIERAKQLTKSAQSFVDFTSNCMVALAAKGAFETDDVHCGILTLKVNGKSYRLPSDVSKKVADFTLERPVKPFSFELNLE